MMHLRSVPAYVCSFSFLSGAQVAFYGEGIPVVTGEGGGTPCPQNVARWAMARASGAI
ncbi:hypothetical protein SSIG_07230 [Streptomyces filamentosus NRRL 11379]|nr:hypothetical protein SSIG_07230 [Streptomyces filamentosus NRRL 11379]